MGKFSLTLRLRATDSPNLPKECAPTGSKSKGVPKKAVTGATPAHTYDTLYVDSSGGEDEMEDVQPSSSFNRPVGGDVMVTVAPSNDVLARCFNELLKARNEVILKADIF